jgi:hypothetical protein
MAKANPYPSMLVLYVLLYLIKAFAWIAHANRDRSKYVVQRHAIKGTIKALAANKA